MISNLTMVIKGSLHQWLRLTQTWLITKSHGETQENPCPTTDQEASLPSMTVAQGPLETGLLTINDQTSRLVGM